MNKFTTLKFLSLLPSMNGQFFLDYHVLLCNKTCNTYMGIIVIRPPWLSCEFLAELPLMLIFWS